jgi:malonate-semialdehyde dehydrogenase (acetylating)/methylmalonate-semialdehyde dehydrogenase
MFGTAAKNLRVVMPDARLDAAVPNMINSVYGCAGERCLAGSAVVAIGDAHDATRRAFASAASRLKVGYGLDESVEMGPVISRKHRERVLGYVDRGVEEGAKVVLDGRGTQVPGYPGYFVGPTILDGVTPDMAVGREEVFGPVASFVEADSLDEAIEAINRSGYGNAASIYTSSGPAAREFRYRVRAGNVGINVGVAAPMAYFPFGGMKNSFFGDLHPQGRDAIRFFTESKVVITRWF